jgi:hypothetical protein
MTEGETPKYRTKRILENGMLKYLKVPLNPDDELHEKNLEISRLKSLIDELRNKVEQLEQEQQRHQLKSGAVDEAESYNIYK